MKKEQKKDKKKLLVLALFLFAIVGFAGYGVYSYYFTQGSFDSDSDTIQVASFDPETVINGSSSEFLGNGGTVSLDCGGSSGYYHSNGKETITCTGSVEVHNNGGTDIDVEYFETSSGVNGSGMSLSADTSNLKFDWSNSYDSSTTRISAGSSDTLNISVDVVVDNGATNGMDNENAEEVSSPIYGGEFSVDVDFRLKATQVH